MKKMLILSILKRTEWGSWLRDTRSLKSEMSEIFQVHFFIILGLPYFESFNFEQSDKAMLISSRICTIKS